MAFTFKLIVDENTDSLNSDGRFVKEYHRRYLCQNNIDMTLDAVKAAVGILPGAPHPVWSFATCRRIHPTKLMTKEPHCAWHVDYDWSTEGVVPENVGSTTPEDRRVKRRTGTAQQQRFIIKDRNGVLITDAAGSPFDGGVPVTDYMGTLIFERDENHTALSMAQGAVLSGKLNSAPFMGCDPETLMLDVVGEEKHEGTYHFWTFTYTMTYDKDGWQPKPANAGLWENTGSLGSPNRTRITEDDGTDTLEPQPLYPANFTSPLPGSKIPPAARPAACNFITVDHYITFDFAILGLPTS